MDEDLKKLKKELRCRLIRGRYEAHCYLNAHETPLPEALLGKELKQSLHYWAKMAAYNRLAEVNALKDAIKKIDEQIKKQAVKE